MKTTPQLKYFLYNADQAVQEESEVWAAPIPLSRKPSDKKEDISISHGDYFCAVRDFLEKDSFRLILSALSQQIRRDVTCRKIKEIRIYLAKHGEFYHPARIETVLPESSVALVLNVAVSSAGKDCALREYRLLQKLDKDFSFSLLPRVFGRGRVFVKAANLELRMFLGEWLEGYNEFHISRDPADDKLKIVVWDSEVGNYFLTTSQTMELYRQAAMALTGYYHIETFEHIFSWHHAAGDFVVKCQSDKVDLKLVTVRQYGPMFVSNNEPGSQSTDAVIVLEALLVFFLKLVMQMRLDRLDGTGEIVWSDKVAVEQSLKGFLDALALKSPGSPLAEPLVACFQQHLSSYTRSELLALNRVLVAKYHPRSPDLAVIQQHLAQHVDDLYAAVHS
ncbi:MAG: hypothetical protein V3S16_09330 [Candidatus Desulfatibia sp.]|uniref:hypothetical protein n=1 Tax=Candidatus Desulfatibia sp. TaxID=3101189 RepID=UPI002F2DA589